MSSGSSAESPKETDPKDKKPPAQSKEEVEQLIRKAVEKYPDLLEGD